MSPITGVPEVSTHPAHAPHAAPALHAPHAPLRRVRHEVRDGVLLMSFSAAVSCGAAGFLVLLSRTLG